MGQKTNSLTWERKPWRAMSRYARRISEPFEPLHYPLGTGRCRTDIQAIICAASEVYTWAEAGAAGGE